MVAELAAAAQRAGRPARVHLKVDTGMSRGGATMSDWPGVVAAALAAEAAGHVAIVGVWSHLACADMPGHGSIDAQLKAFREAIAVAEAAGRPATDPPPRQHSRHADAAAGPVRPGPVRRRRGRPAHAARAHAGLAAARDDRAGRLVQVKQVPPGAGVSSGHRYFTSSQSVLGLVPLGYAEGVPRDASGLVQVYARGRRWFIAGTVSMNQFVMDFGAEPAAEGDEVLLFGPGDDGEPTAQDWADALEPPSATRSPPGSAAGFAKLLWE